MDLSTYFEIQWKIFDNDYSTSQCVVSFVDVIYRKFKVVLVNVFSIDVLNVYILESDINYGLKNYKKYFYYLK